MIKESPFLITIFTFVLWTQASCTGGADSWKERPVAKVDQYELTSAEFARRLSRKLKIFDALTAKDTSVVKQSKDDVVNGFILEMLTLRWAQNNAVFVRKESLDKEIKELREAYPDPLAFKRSLTEEGLSFQEWKNLLRFSLLQKMVFQKQWKIVLIV